WKVVVIILWLPLAAFLSLLFHPTFHASLESVVVFFIAIWGAYLIRSLELWSLGMVTFWTTRVGPVFDVFFTAELLLSGRLAPLALRPDWAQELANSLPFKWTFSFPIEALIGGLPTSELVCGVFMQPVWIVERQGLAPIPRSL